MFQFLILLLQVRAEGPRAIEVQKLFRLDSNRHPNRSRGVRRGSIPAVALLLLLAIPAAGAPRVQFSREILPVLNRECLSCHKGSAAPGKYSLESAEQLLAGGRHGKAVVPGKSKEGTLIRYLTGELKPQMPPGKPLSLETIALIRRWIDEGAVIDSMVDPTAPRGAGTAMPRKAGTAGPRGAQGRSAGLLPAPVAQSAPVTALAYSPDGKLVAAGGYRAVRLLDPAAGTLVQTLSGPSDQVLSLAWSTDGKRLLAAGGVPGVTGELCLWEVPASGTWGKPRILKGHSDTIQAVSWHPGGTEFASASLDKTVKTWDAAGGSVKRTLKEHVDAVFGVAYSPDGKWLASGSADRTVKLYELGREGPPTSFQNGDGVVALAFGPKSDLIAAACLDRQVRVWPAKSGTVPNPLRSHGEGEAINSVAFSADGSTFAWGAANRKVQLWNGDVSGRKREMSDPTDWVYSVAVSADGKRVAAGAGDGKVYFWNGDDGKLERAVPLGPGAAVLAGAEARK